MTTVPARPPDRAAVLDRLFDVSGLGAVVTRAASGLGLAIAEVLACCGARVTLVDADAERLAVVTDDLAGRGLSVQATVDRFLVVRRVVAL